VAERHKYYCYMMLTSRVLQANGYNWGKTAQVCLRDAEPKWRDECFQSFGRDASGQARSNVEAAAANCAKAPAEWRSECVFGAARDMVSEDAVPTRAARFCALLDPGSQGRCANGAGTIVGDLGTDASGRNAACATAFEAAGLRTYVADCQAGARR